MNNLRVSHSLLSGKIFLSPSKSHSIRAIIFASLAKGISWVRNYLRSPDIQATIVACRQLGASIEEKGNDLKIVGFNGKPKLPDDVIDAKNSGQVLRFIGALTSLCEGATVITGDASVRSQRPCQPLLDAINDLGGRGISTRGNGLAPIVIEGPIHPGEITMLAHDSQPISGMLMAQAFLPGPSKIYLKEAGEIPWIGLTLNWFDRLKIDYRNDNFTMIEMRGQSQIDAFDYSVVGDMSSLAFPLCAALITHSDICIENVDLSDVQGDKKIIEILQDMGAVIEPNSSDRSLWVYGSRSSLKGREIDINDCIDAITILAVMGCYVSGTTVITGAAIARQKECDRIHCIASELKKMGADIEERPDGLVIHQSPLKGARVRTYHDHRMVMSLAVAGMGAKGITEIEDYRSIHKSYPLFISDMQQLQALIEMA